MIPREIQLPVRSVTGLCCALVLLLFSTIATPATTRLVGKLNVAVASNFTPTLKLLAADFQQRTGYHVLISSSSTGKLYTQIHHGAPFDIFLAADEITPGRLIAEGKARSDRARVYAVGKLVMLSNTKTEGDCSGVLTSQSLKHLAIANPDTAPYGAAAKQVLEKLNLWNELKPKLVVGENIAQALQSVATGSADAGFVAKSMVVNNTEIKYACIWKIPDELYSPIRQKMVVLRKAAVNPAVEEFWSYLRSDAAIGIIKNAGYELP